MISSLERFECSFFADKTWMTKEIFRKTGLISEDRHSPSPVFCPCIKAGNYAGLFLQATYLLAVWFNPAP